MTEFLIYVLRAILGLAELAIIVSAILSWLVAFNVINVRHPAAYGFVRFLDAVTRPILWPFRRVIPPLGGVDVTPLIAIIVLQGIRGPLLQWVGNLLYPVIG